MRLPLTLLPNGSRPFDVVGQGLNSFDLYALVASYPRRNSKHRLERFVRLTGGQVATAMVTIARLGWRARYVGRFGEDEPGAVCIASLEREGVDTSASLRVPGATNHFSLLIVDASGERTVLWDRDPALTMTPADVDAAVIRSGRVLHVDGYEAEPAGAAARAARAAGMCTVIDIEGVHTGTVELLRHIDVIIAAEEFPALLTGQQDLGRALAAMAEEFKPAMVCVTLGPAGSLALVQGKEIRTPAFKVPVVDTTGAGDVFRGAFISALLAAGSRPTAEELLTYANAAAALQCRTLGAQTGIPRADEVERFLRDAVAR